MIGRSLLALFLVFPLIEAQTRPSPAAVPPSKPTEDAQLYRNTSFGFRYRIPYGWVDRTKEMNGEELNAQPKAPAENTPDAANQNPPKKDPEQKTTVTGSPAADAKPSSQGQVLLAIFERPPNAPGDTVNSAVVIVTESASTYPGLKKAEDYLGPLTELTTAKGFKPEGDPDVIEIDKRQLIRADFAKPLGPAKDPTKDNDTLTMHQSTLVLLARGQILSLTFIAGSEDEVDDLIDALHFVGGKFAAH